MVVEVAIIVVVVVIEVVVVVVVRSSSSYRNIFRKERGQFRRVRKRRKLTKTEQEENDPLFSHFHCLP